MVSNIQMNNQAENSYVVVRYHSESVPFDTLVEAEDFAACCGDFADMVMPTRPAQDEIDHFDSFDHYSYE